MAATRLCRSPIACANVLTHTFGAPALRSQTSISSTVFTASRSLTTCQPAQPLSRPALHTTAPPTKAHILRRAYASASPAQPLPTTGSTPGAAAATSSPADLLTWDQFFTMRRRRRYVGIGVSVIGALAAVIYGSPLIGAFDIDTKLSEATGVDPLVVIGVGSLAVAGGGWFVGRILGGVVFSLLARQRGWARIFAEKEKSFFDRIKRYRADPSSSSPQNPIPDYYGEKIGSVKDYSRWLKDQRAFTKKMYRGVR